MNSETTEQAKQTKQKYEAKITNVTPKELLVEYFEVTLVTVNGFKKTGNCTFFYKDERDTIFVYVTDNNVTVISDGKDVIDGISMMRLFDIKSCGYDSLRELYDIFDYCYYQNILHLF